MTSSPVTAVTVLVLSSALRDLAVGGGEGPAQSGSAERPSPRMGSAATVFLKAQTISDILA